MTQYVVVFHEPIYESEIFLQASDDKDAKSKASRLYRHFRQRKGVTIHKATLYVDAVGPANKVCDL